MKPLVIALICAAMINLAFVLAGQTGPGEQLLRLPGYLVIVAIVASLLICASGYEE
jgi:hypothetical protein